MDFNVKRGIDFQNRLWDSSLAKKLRGAFGKSKPINKFTFFGIISVSIINAILVSAFFRKDLSPSFALSVFWKFSANLVSNIGILSTYQFYLILIIGSLLLAPITIYLFARRIAGRNELTAFLSTLFFILPNQLTLEKPSLLTGVLLGDGPHIIILSFLPLFLLYFRSFIDTGMYFWGFFAVIGTTLIALFSPFGFLNLLIFMIIITISEGFMGGFRIKFSRLFFILIASFGLSNFWYNPRIIADIIKLESFRIILIHIWNNFPILIPALPVLGSLAFLIFDRREKLKPVFVGISLFIIYYFILGLTSSINTSGVLMSQRLNPEFALSKAFILGLTFSFIIEFLVFKIRDYRSKQNNKMMIWALLPVIGIIIIITGVFVAGLVNIGKMITEIRESQVYSLATPGIGSIERRELFSDMLSVFSVFISLITLAGLLYLVKFFPGMSFYKKEK